MRHVLLILSFLAAGCGGGSKPNAHSDADPPQPDAREPSGFLGECQKDSECVSELCLEGPHVCTAVCGYRTDCPYSSSWRCQEVLSAGNKQCLCPGLGMAAGCDADCDGVDEDPVGSWFHAAQSTIVLPTTLSESLQVAFDLELDGNVENAFGRTIFPAFAQIMTGSAGGTTQLAALNQDAVSDGRILLLHSFHGEGTATESCASWRVHIASPSFPPDFSGSGTFELAPNVAPGTSLYGSVVAGTFTGAFGEIPIRLKMGPSSNSIITLRLRGAQIVSSVDPSGCVSGRLGGGISIEEADAKIVPLFASEINYVLMTNPQPPHAQQLKAIFDTNQDNVIFVDEARANPIVQSVISPDLDLVHADGSPGPDGINDAISIAFGFGCVGAVYAAPGE